MIGKIKNGRLENDYKPHWGQRLIHNDPARFRICVCGRRFGKALAVDTPILTKKGFKPLADVLEGDFVFGEDGASYKVSYKSPIYLNRECYQITFSDGSQITADSDHDWMVETKSIRKNNARNIEKIHELQKITTKDLKQDLFITRHDGKKETNYSIPTTKPLIGEVIDYPIDEYFLGLWIGDGNSRNIGVTTADEDVVCFLYSYADSLGDRIRIDKNSNQENKSNTYYIVGDKDQKSRNSSLQSLLNSHNLLNNKHIPNDFLTASFDQRLALLQGLMDSDGYCQDGFYEYCSTNRNVADGVEDLISTFGIKVSRYESDASIYGKVTSKKYRLCFSTDIDLFRIERKRIRQKMERKSDIKRRFVVAVDSVCSVPVQCLMVENPTHLFLCGRALIPTHNTVLALNELYKQAYLNRDKLARCWYIAPNYRQAKTVAWEMLKETIPDQMISAVNEAELSIRLMTGGMIELKGADSQDSLRGAKLKFAVLDEYATMRPTVWDEVIRPALIDSRDSRAMFIGTPSGFNHFKVLFDKGNSGDSEYKSFRFSTIDNPYIPKDEVEDIRKKTNAVIFRQEYEASFEQMSGSIYPMFRRDTHVVKAQDLDPEWDRVVAMDWGSRNATAILFAAIDPQGVIYIYDCLYGSGRTVSQWAEIVKYRADYESISSWVIDPSALAQAREFGQYGIYFHSYNPDTNRRINDVTIGINLVSQYFLENKIRVFAHCESLIREIEQYQWEPSTSKLGAESRAKPLKKDDHSVDSLRYLVMTRPKGHTAKKEKYKGLDGASEMFWRSHFKDMPKEVEFFQPRDTILAGIDESYGTDYLGDLWG